MLQLFHVGSHLGNSYDGDIEVSIYNMFGQAILTTNDKIIDLSSFDNATYLFIITDLLHNSINSFKIIKL